MISARFVLPCALVALADCRPVEARDPHEILEEDPAFLGSEAEAYETDETPTQDEKTKKPPERAASFAQCQTAARRIHEVGIDLAIAEAKDPGQRRELENTKTEMLDSPAMKDRIRRDAEDCVGRGTSEREAACIAKIRADRDIDACMR